MDLRKAVGKRFFSHRTFVQAWMGGRFIPDQISEHALDFNFNAGAVEDMVGTVTAGCMRL